jgi:hypothetical protein
MLFTICAFNNAKIIICTIECVQLNAYNDLHRTVQVFNTWCKDGLSRGSVDYSEYVFCTDTHI